MLQEQFYYRLLLIIGFGIIYVKTMIKMAQYKPDDTKRRNVVMRVLGGLLVLLAVFESVMGVYYITQIEHPTQMIDLIPNPNQIVRPSSSHIVWGYVTTAQWLVVSQISNAMTSLGWAAYFLFYRKSATTWWKKVLKFVFAVLLSIFYYSATDFHYFDFWEWIAPGLFGIMAYFVEMRVKKSLRKIVATPQEVLESHPIEGPDEIDLETKQEDEARFMPQTISGNVTESEDMLKEEKTEVDNKPIEVDRPSYKFCRYCGKQIDYEGVKYCKHCGKPID